MPTLAGLTRCFVSQSALANIVQELKKDPDTTLSSRRGIKRARENAVDFETPYGKLMLDIPLKLPATKKEKETTFMFPFVNPWALLWHYCNVSEEYSMFLKKRHELEGSRQDSQWDIIVYGDEVSAGNVLRHDNKRKCQVGMLSMLRKKLHFVNSYVGFRYIAINVHSFKCLSNLMGYC